MSNEEGTVGSSVGATRRSPRQGAGGSPVGSTLSIVLAVVAVIAGFLILRNLTADDSSSAGGSSTPVVTDVQPTTTFDVGITTTIAVAPTTTAPLVTEGATVVVANANTVGGSAGRMSESLADVGYNMGSPVNGTVTIDESLVYYDPTNTAALGVAESLARSLGGVVVDVLPTPATGRKRLSRWCRCVTDVRQRRSRQDARKPGATGCGGDNSRPQYGPAGCWW